MEGRASEGRSAAVCAIGGSALLFVGTWLHPMGADPNDPVAAFTEYAADRPWVASHLTQLAGVALMAAALLLIMRRLEGGWPRIASGAAIASLAVAAALQAVDGVALKVMVDTWAAAPASEKDAALRAAFAVRQVEVGMASMASLLLGLTATASGVALWREPAVPRWLGGLAILGGVPTMIAGIAIAYTGFSGLEMAINMPANSLLLIWMLILGAFLWRRPEVGWR